MEKPKQEMFIIKDPSGESGWYLLAYHGLIRGADATVPFDEGWDKQGTWYCFNICEGTMGNERYTLQSEDTGDIPEWADKPFEIHDILSVLQRIAIEKGRD